MATYTDSSNVEQENLWLLWRRHECVNCIECKGDEVMIGHFKQNVLLLYIYGSICKYYLVRNIDSYTVYSHIPSRGC